jgi:hypothetical protein
MKIIIEPVDMIDGRWLVNGKRYEDMSEEEKEILCKFFKVMKLIIEK